MNEKRDWVWACRMMNRGEKVRLNFWCEHYYWHLVNGAITNSSGNPAILDETYLEMMDWELYEEEKEMSESVKSGSLLDEEWREYEWHPTGWLDDCDASCVYRIDNPKDLMVGSTTHRIVDTDGIVHCVPNVGHMGCVLRWKPKDPERPIAF